MWTRRAFSGLAALVAGAPASAQSGAVSSPRQSEVNAIRAFAEATHPRGLEAGRDADFRNRWDSLAAHVDALDDGRYVTGLRHGLGWFADGHTAVQPFAVATLPPAFAHGPFALALPIKAQMFSDGLWVTEAGAEASGLLGSRMTRVNGVAIEAVLRKHADAWSGGLTWAHRWGGLLFDSPGLLHGLGIVDGPADAAIEVEVQREGKLIKQVLRPRQATDLRRTALTAGKGQRQVWSESARGGNYVHALPDQKTLYLSIDQMGDLGGVTFLDFTRQVFTLMADTTPDRMVIDVRRNGGGDNFLGEALRKHIERSRFNRPGGIYVLTGPQTFSAAQNLINRLERETCAIFVGQPTGGAPNHYGDAKRMTGPVTGVTVFVSTVPWFDSYPMDRRPCTLPDLLIEDTFEDWRAGRDPALEAALSHHAADEDNDLSRPRVFYFDRPSQHAAWSPFWAAAVPQA
jgi:hypothetical protein